MTLGISLLRLVGCLVAGRVFFAGFIWIAFDGRKQGWHDKIAATLVIRTGNKSDAEGHPAGNPTPSVHPLTDVETYSI